MVRVAVDGMGGDHAPRAVVQGALLAARDPALEIVLVGRISEIRPLLTTLPANLHLEDAPDAVGMGEAPAQTIRQKPRSSIMVGLDLVRRGEADAFASFGNTGAVMAASLKQLGRIPGVSRPALGALFENAKGSRTLVLDIGANAECRPLHLAQFATMGKAYVERVLHHRNPSVGLLNVGEEDSKGTPFSVEANELLRACEPAFIGNVEGNGMVAGMADVVVTDGFAGNIAIKVSEGVAELFAVQMRRAVRGRLRYRLGALLMRGAFERLRSHLDYQRVGGAPLFGVNGAVIVGHGRADAEAVANGIRLARNVAQSTFVEALRTEFAALAGRGAAADDGPEAGEPTEAAGPAAVPGASAPRTGPARRPGRL